MEGLTITNIYQAASASRFKHGIRGLAKNIQELHMPVYNSNVFIGREARDMLMRGVDMVADAVKVTLGSRGRNAILQESVYPFHIVTNDGISIAQKIKSRHPVENIGVNIMKEVADRANKESGDGTTTATVLTQAILHEGKEMEIGPELLRSMEECLPIIDELIDKQKISVTVDNVAAAAAISAESKELGEMLQKIYQDIGPEGIVNVEGSGTFETSYEITDGVRLRNCGFMAPYMSNGSTSVTYKNPKILIAKQRIATLLDIDPLFQKLSGSGANELVMFVEDIDPQVLSALAFTHTNGIFKTLIIKAPVLWKDWLFEDFAAMTGATIVAADTGITWKNVGLEHIGTCEKLVTSRDTTIVTGIKDLTAHIEKIKAEQQPQYELRVSWLKTKAAVLKIGANSESELSYKRLKAEDARNAAYLAMQDGVVPGGGLALWNVSQVLPNTIGGNLLTKALKAPLKQIMKNAGEKQEFIDKVEPNNHIGGKIGYDSTDRKFTDMMERGIVDPAKVVKNAVKTAISVAGTVLSAETITTIEKDI